MELNTIAFPGRYRQGVGAFSALPEELMRWKGRALVLVTPSFEEQVRARFGAYSEVSVEVFSGRCTGAEVDRVAEVARARGARVLAGVGGGQTLDCAKAAADRLELDVVIVPTLASTDAPCTGVAILYDEDGSVSDFVVTRRQPAVVLVDEEIIAQAPVRYLVAGMADALSTAYEARSVLASGASAHHGGRPTETARVLAELAADLVLDYGRTARADCEARRVTPALARVIEANILLSGVGCLGTNIAAAHSVHNGLRTLPGTRKSLHGELVAFGVLTGLALNDAPPEEHERLHALYFDLGLPLSLEAIGVDPSDEASLLRAAEEACGPHSLIRNEPVPVTPVALVAALRRADRSGREYAAGRRKES